MSFRNDLLIVLRNKYNTDLDNSENSVIKDFSWRICRDGIHREDFYVFPLGAGRRNIERYINVSYKLPDISFFNLRNINRRDGDFLKTFFCAEVKSMWRINNFMNIVLGSKMKNSNRSIYGLSIEYPFDLESYISNNLTRFKVKASKQQLLDSIFFKKSPKREFFHNPNHLFSKLKSNINTNLLKEI